MPRTRLFLPLYLALFAALLAVVLVGSAAAQAQGGATVTILAERLNVRSGPGTGYTVVRSAAAGEQYSVTGQNGGCAWLQIAKSGKTLGWVSGSKSYVELNRACSAIPAVGAGAGGRAAPAGGAARQGCALLINKLKFAVQLSVKRSSDGWQRSWSIPVGARTEACVDPGSYTATFTAASTVGGQSGSMAFPLVVKSGEYYEIPLSLP